MGKTNQSGIAKLNEMVITPGGWRLRSNVHYIEPGHHISGKDGIIRKIHTKSGKIIKEYGPINSDRDKTRKSLRTLKKQTLSVAAPEPITDQWIIYSGWTNDSGMPISYFSTNWRVPPPPASDNNQLIYIFNGIENAANNVILQPVLQWGVSPIGGGAYWAIANWYVGAPGSGLALHGPLIRVNEGDKLQGLMTLTNHDNGFSYNSSFVGYAADLNVTDIGELVWVVETLECYGFKQFSDYPNTLKTAMSAIEIKTGNIEATIQWDAFNAVTDNGQHCDIVSNNSPNGEVDLYYRNGEIA